MIRQGSAGSVLLVSSPHAFIAVPRSMAYNMAKAAVEQMAKTAALELADHRIRVNVMQPGWTDTPGERKLKQRGRASCGRPPDPLGPARHGGRNGRRYPGALRPAS